MSNFKRSDKSLILKDVEVRWASLSKPNNMSGKYQIDLSNLTDAQIKQIESLDIDGIKPSIRTREDQPEAGKFITVKSNREIYALDTNGDRINVSVGNGSRANLRIGSYKWKKPVGSGEGVSLTLDKLVITNLIEYVPERDDSELFSTDTI